MPSTGRAWTSRSDTTTGWGTPEASVARLLALQSDSGAFVASPDFAQYQFCWLRDASFVAHALDVAGAGHAVNRFHAWCVRAVESVAKPMTRAIEAVRRGEDIDTALTPPARFSLSGATPTHDGWPNFQIDGYGTWLWALAHHLDRTSGGILPPAWRNTVELAAEYLATLAFSPCWDVWEENGAQIHTSTLASVCAGLLAASRIINKSALQRRAEEVRDRISEHTGNGRFQKSNVQSQVDASTLWLFAPFEIIPVADARARATVEQIERELMFEGGVRRYPQDTYFGGGAWPVLTCSLGLYYHRAGRIDDAERCLAWTRAHFDSEGQLGEQFGGERRDPTHYAHWVELWGPPAAELLWSHAMYVLLANKLDGPDVFEKVPPP